MAGSSQLTAEQQDWYGQRFGTRFVAVQENHLRPSRRVRRALKHGPSRAVSPLDERVYRRQQQLIEKLTADPMRARPS